MAHARWEHGAKTEATFAIGIDNFVKAEGITHSLIYHERTIIEQVIGSRNLYLSDRANKDGECWPAIPTIAKELKLSESTIHRVLRDLRSAGLLETEQRYREKGGKSSLLYKISGK